MFEIMGAVLAGGRSSRMGHDKAEVRLRGGTMAELVAAALTAHLSQVVVIGRDRPLAGLDAIADPGAPHQGPLAGLVAALESAGRPVLLVGVDQPMLRADTVERLAQLGSKGRSVVCHDDVPQVTCAVYQPDVLGTARQHLDRGGSIRSMLDDAPHTVIPRQDWEAWGEDGRSWCSLDSRDDIVAAERRFRVNLLD